MNSWVVVASSAQQQVGTDPVPALVDGGAAVTVVVTDDFVIDAVAAGEAERLRARGVRVLFDGAALARRGLASRIDPRDVGTYDDIAALLLDPRSRVVWR